MKTMKTTMPISPSTNRKPTVTLLTIGSILAVSMINTTAAPSPDPLPMCAKFVGDTSYLGSDGGGERIQAYCNAEPDVVCVSSGGFYLYTKDGRKGAPQRKLYINLKTAPQFNSPPITISSLPAGEFEATFGPPHPNNEDGTSDDGAGGCLPGGPLNVFEMAPGEFRFASLSIAFTDTTTTASKGEYRIRFGQPICEPNFSWNMRSDCPVIFTAEDDLDSDGLADIWTIEPARLEARAILLKVNKRQQFDVVGFFGVFFKLVFIREQDGAVLTLID